MNTYPTIQHELQALKSTLPPVKKPVFSVPDGYFENFALSVLLKINENNWGSAAEELIQLSPLLASCSKKMPQSVPENYFSSLVNEIPVLIGNEELPSILSLERKNPYKTPEGYFESFETQMLAKVAPKSKVISMRFGGFQRMAVAAAVIGLIALSSIAYFTGGKNNSTTTEANTWVAKNLKSVSDQDLEEFIKNAEVTANGTGLQTPARVAEARILLKDVSTDELDDFLAAVPTDDEELLIIN